MSSRNSSVKSHSTMFELEIPEKTHEVTYTNETEDEAVME